MEKMAAALKPCLGFILMGLSLEFAWALEDFDQQLATRRQQLRLKYGHLYSQQVQTQTDGRKTFDQGTLFLREGINVLHLKGDPFEMAFQHGTLLKEQIRDGAIMASLDLVYNNVRMSVGNRPILINLMTRYIHRNYTDKMLRFTLDTFENHTGGLDQGIGMADATGYEVKSLVRALFAPEVLMVLAAERGKTMASRFISPYVGHCSAFAARGDFTTDGDMIIGRNTDYPINGYYDKYPTVIYFEPNGSQRFVSVVSAGVHNGGLVSLNESGIFLAVHTLPTTAVSANGIPAFLIATLAIKQATTFDEAVAMFDRYRAPTGWAFTLISYKENRMGTIELNNERMALREISGERHVQTNRFEAPEMVDQELFFNQSVDRDSDLRKARLLTLIAENQGQIDERAAIAFMSDHVNADSGRVSTFPNTVSVHTTMTSVVLKPQSKVMFVANGRAPVADSTFVEMPTIEGFDVSSFPQQPYQTIANGHFATDYPNKWQALQFFIKAKMAYEYEFDIGKSLDFLASASAIDPENASYDFIAAILALRWGSYSQAKNLLSKMFEKNVVGHRWYLAHYYLGRIAASQRRWQTAREHLEYLTKALAIDDKLKNAAQRTLNRLGGIRRIPIDDSSLKVMFQQSDVMEY